VTRNRDWDGDHCIRKECRNLPVDEPCEHEKARRQTALGIIEDTMQRSGLKRREGIAGTSTDDAAT
jgi:hypothetical protein